MTDFSKGVPDRARRVADRGVPPAKGSQEPRHPALGRRTPPYGDRARGGHQPGVHPARRAVRGRRPHRRGGHPVDRGDAQLTRTSASSSPTTTSTRRWPSPTAPTCSTRARSSRRVRPRNWPPTRWFAKVYLGQHFRAQEEPPADPADEEPQGTAGAAGRRGDRNTGIEARILISGCRPTPVPIKAYNLHNGQDGSIGPR